MRTIVLLEDAALGVAHAVAVREKLFACMEGRNAVEQHDRMLYELGVCSGIIHPCLPPSYCCVLLLAGPIHYKLI